MASLTPVYDELFLRDWSAVGSAYVGKHESEVWKLGTGDTHISNRITLGYPNLMSPKQRISAASCTDACNPPSSQVSFGSVQGEHYMDQWVVNSQPFCLTQLRYNTRPQEQATMIINGLKKIPKMHVNNYIRTRAFTQSPSVEIAGPLTSSIPSTFTPNVGVNVDAEMSVIDLGSAAALPTSQLTFPYLDYITTKVGLRGYHEKPSGLGAGMYNLITSDRAWFKLTNGNDSMKNMMALPDPQSASPLYKVGQGIQKPFGNYAPSLDEVPARFQWLGSGVGSGGLLQQIQPFVNISGTTGTQQIPNPIWINAKFELGFVWHPSAVKIFSPDFKKIHPLVPSINTGMFGQWRFVNDPGAMIYTNPDGTTCTYDNVDQNYFYWRVRFEMGFQYLEPYFVLPILYQIDGSGLGSIANDPTCLATPAYVAYDPSDNPVRCTT